jgi:hypothetical protein
MTPGMVAGPSSAGVELVKRVREIFSDSGWHRALEPTWRPSERQTTLTVVVETGGKRR